MIKDLVSIQEAADLSKKSIQTIRRAIKAKKFKFRRDKTPQGFNYMIDKGSLVEFYGINVEAQTNSYVSKKSDSFKRPALSFESESETMTINVDDFKAFAQTLKTMISQHSEERQNFLRLVNTMQEKIFVLENQINLLKAPQKKWFSFWK